MLTPPQALHMAPCAVGSPADQCCYPQPEVPGPAAAQEGVRDRPWDSNGPYACSKSICNHPVSACTARAPTRPGLPPVPASLRHGSPPPSPGSASCLLFPPGPWLIVFSLLRLFPAVSSLPLTLGLCAVPIPILWPSWRLAGVLFSFLSVLPCLCGSRHASPCVFALACFLCPFSIFLSVCVSSSAFLPDPCAVRAYVSTHMCLFPSVCISAFLPPWLTPCLCASLSPSATPETERVGVGSEGSPARLPPQRTRAPSSPWIPQGLCSQECARAEVWS